MTSSHCELLSRVLIVTCTRKASASYFARFFRSLASRLSQWQYLICTATSWLDWKSSALVQKGHGCAAMEFRFLFIASRLLSKLDVSDTDLVSNPMPNGPKNFTGVALLEPCVRRRKTSCGERRRYCGSCLARFWLSCFPRVSTKRILR